MNTRQFPSSLLACILALTSVVVASAQTKDVHGATGLAQTSAGNIDLPTVLKLAGADNLDVQLAREKISEAQAAYAGTRQRFFPWLTPAVAFQRHEGNAQTVNGPIIDADKQSFSVGLTLAAQVDLGETYYQNLAAKQLVHASEAAFEARRREAVFLATAAYFDLARARASVAAAIEAARVAENYATQIAAAAEGGVAFKGDAFRVAAARERSQLLVQQLREAQRLASSRLAQLLRLHPGVELVPTEDNLVPLSLVTSGGELGPVIARALAARPEIESARAREHAADASVRGASYGPLIPKIGAQAALGGLGGGTGSAPPERDFDSTADYMLGLSWHVGPGGLFDSSRKQIARSAERLSALETERITNEIRRQVVDQHAHLQSLAEQLTFSRNILEAAEKTAQLSRDRRQFGVGMVLEDLQAEEELARSRRDYFATTAEYNKAQYALRYVSGD